MTTNKTDDVKAEILAEMKKQKEKWGEQNHTFSRWSTILIEEVGEACAASLQTRESDLRDEMIQVAAVAFSMLESFDRGHCR